MLCLKVPKTKGEKVRNKLLEENLLQKRGRITSDEEFLYFPIKKVPSEDMDFEVVEKEVEMRENKFSDYREAVEIPSGFKEKLPSSYDIIGDIAIIKIPDELKDHKNEIGDAILRTHNNVNSVLEDHGVIGEFRIRDVETIAGIDKKTTIHKEYGIELEVDITSTYFSPRLATERWRVVKKTQPKEKVLDMFAGVGPYSILIAKNVDVERIYCIDINPQAIALLKKNAERNNVVDIIDPHLGDSKRLAPMFSVDRIIMNLPHSSFEFLESALKAAKRECTIHYYEMVDEEEQETRVERVKQKIIEYGFEPKIIEQRDVRSYSAYTIHKALDIEVRR